ncbi:MAG: Do family serine endopeptidase [Marinilabiliaceae bacterium]|nr:Do family serine endopeptidase [Marinilabiliaceae bacterium]
MKKIITTVAITLGCVVFGAFIHARYIEYTTLPTPTNSHNIEGFAGQTEAQAIRVATSYAPTDFTDAAQKSVESVVHVKVMQESRQPSFGTDDPFLQFFFGPRMQPQHQGPQLTGSGSGVIISNDGYIVTNNHVIDKADKIEIVLNDKRVFEGTLIGTDPTTDIALVKIEAANLQPLAFGNSDALKVGEWVLAVGNPFNLTSTVTAGIVSAKSRSMGMNGNQMGIESFIQTDAAVNPGNSGGALVNTRGELVGINTAIASNTGSYTGYSFAVPTSIVQKVAADLKEFGEVQRALLGVTIAEVNNELQKKYNLEKPEGIIVMDIAEGSAAKEAGIQQEDIIISVDDITVNTVPELQEKIAQHRPGDSVRLKIIRNNKELEIMCTLRNIRGTTDIVNVSNAGNLLGGVLKPLNDEEKVKTGLRYGLKVEQAGNGKLRESGVKDGFIILKANRTPVTNVKDLEQIAATASEGLFISGVYPNGKVAYYAVNIQD